MCLVYVTSAMFIITSNIARVPEMIQLIFTQAFSGDAIYGGVLGVMIIGITRAAFSNEAGIGLRRLPILQRNGRSCSRRYRLNGRPLY